jgi:hypothetical protein
MPLASDAERPLSGACLAELNKLTEAQRSRSSQPSSVSDRFKRWYHLLPAVSRNRRFSMSVFEAAPRTQGKFISPVLLELGWRSRLGAQPGNTVEIGSRRQRIEPRRPALSGRSSPEQPALTTS